MPDRLEAAASGRARCRACAVKIDKGALRFGEELPNSYGEGEAQSVYWFHPRCAAQRRPEKFLPLAQAGGAAALADVDALIAEAELGAAHPRLQRIAGGERSASGRALCRHCKQLIGAQMWRLRLSIFAASGFFEPLGFIHATCSLGYFGVSASIGERVQQASPDLDVAALDEIRAAALVVSPEAPPSPDAPVSGAE